MMTNTKRRVAAGTIAGLLLCTVGPLAAASPQTTFVPHDIVQGYTQAIVVHAADLDGDGDQDVIGGSRYGLPLTWWENDGQQGFTTAHAFGGDISDVAGSIATFDADHDGDTDVATLENGWYLISWWENDGSGEFTRHTLPQPAALLPGYPELATGDLDSDGNTDIVVPVHASYSYPLRGLLLVWYRNDGTGSFTMHELAWPTFPQVASGVSIADLDGDSDTDILVATVKDETEPDDKLYWYVNDGSEVFTSQLIGLASMAAVADIDGDGDLDIAGASHAGNFVAWWENKGGANFMQHPVGAYMEPFDIEAVDVDGDGDIDIVNDSIAADTVSWWENDGHQSFTEHLLGEVDGPVFFFTTDLDGDHDLDVLTPAYEGNRITWWEQVGPSCKDIDFSHYLWQVATWDAPGPATHSCDNVALQDNQLVLKHTGLVDSDKKAGLAQTYKTFGNGVFEANIKAPSDPGVVIAFFLYSEWEDPKTHIKLSDEIDFELLPGGGYLQAATYDDWNEVDGYEKSVHHDFSKRIPIDVWDSFHDFRIVRSDTLISFYVDQELVWSTDSVVPEALQPMLLEIWSVTAADPEFPFAGTLASDEIEMVVDHVADYELPQEAIHDIVAEVEALVEGGTLGSGQGNALMAKLDAAARSIDKGNVTPAINQLEAFINQMDAFIGAALVTPGEGQALVDAANGVIDSLGG
jgi:hypothetical protein